MLMVLQTAPVQRPQQSTSQSQLAQQIQQPLTQNQHNPILQLRQIQAQQQAIQGQQTTGASSTIQNRSATSRLSTAANARPLGQQGQHLQQGWGVQVSVPLQAGVAWANMVSFSLSSISSHGLILNGLPQAVPAKSYPTPNQCQYILWITTKFYSRTGWQNSCSITGQLIIINIHYL